MRFSLLMVAFVVCVMTQGIAPPARAQVLGAQPGYNSVLLKQEARRQQFQAQQQARRAQMAAEAARRQQK